MSVASDILSRMKTRKGSSSGSASGATGSDGDGTDDEETGEGSDMEESYDSAGADALDEMTTVLGLEGEQASQFKSAMSDYVKACMGEAGSKSSTSGKEEA